MENQPPELLNTPKPTDSFKAHFKALEEIRLFPIIDAALKRPAQVVHELMHGQGWKASASLLLILLFCLAGNLLVGAQLSWNLRPFIGSPDKPVQFLRPNPFEGNLYENVFHTAKDMIEGNGR